MTADDIIQESSDQVEEAKELYKLACSLIAKDYPNEQVLEQLDKTNKSFKSPIEDAEVFETFDSAKNYMSSKKKKNGKDERTQSIFSMSVPGLVDVVEHEGQLKYLMSGGELLTEYQDGKTIFIPPQRQNLPPRFTGPKIR